MPPLRFGNRSDSKEGEWLKLVLSVGHDDGRFRMIADEVSQGDSYQTVVPLQSI